SILENLEKSDEIDEETRESLQETIDAGNKEAVKEREDIGDADKNPHEPDLPADPADEKFPRPGPRKERYDVWSSKQPAPVFICNGQGSDDVDRLPGVLVRQLGQPPVKDKMVNECYDAINKAQTFFREVYRWNSYDDKNSQLIGTVHHGKNFANAFFLATKRQMAFGDGNKYILNFNKSPEIVGHELTHGIIQFSSGMIYFNESGALNESCADVMSTLFEQWSLNQTADKADWVLAQDVLIPWDPKIAMRSMKAPGTAYNDPRLGKDPQPAHMKNYVKTKEDNGGVHTNSGIPNHAFYLAATRFGGKAWEVPGRTWFTAMTTSKPRETFEGFARRTIVDAVFNPLHPTWAGILIQAWRDVGVLPQQATWYDRLWALTCCGGRIAL
ncbi:MAG: hypothetical protein L6R41_008095, partial [Letrouitia leprolyta]